MALASRAVVETAQGEQNRMRVRIPIRPTMACFEKLSNNIYTWEGGREQKTKSWTLDRPELRKAIPAYFLAAVLIATAFSHKTG